MGIKARPVRVSKDGVVQECHSLTAAAKYIGLIVGYVEKSSVRQAIIEKRTCKGFTVEYMEEK